MKVLFTLVFSLLSTAIFAQLPDCQWCGTSEAPANIGSSTKIASPREPGKRIIISGTVYQEDGVTPAPNVVIYVYHTDAAGIYRRTSRMKGNAQRHGLLRGWMKTGSDGKYQFETIRPGYYPRGIPEPAHIHYILEAPNYPEYWIAALWFEDDPRVEEQNLEDVERKGGFSNITNLKRNSQGYYEGERNIILKKY